MLKSQAGHREHKYTEHLYVYQALCYKYWRHKGWRKQELVSTFLELITAEQVTLNQMITEINIKYNRDKCYEGTIHVDMRVLSKISELA